MRVILGGDFSPQNRLEELIRSNKYQDSLYELKNIFNSADFAIVNLETTIPTEKSQPINKLGPNLRSAVGTIDVLNWLGVNIVTLANNHAYDFGPEALSNVITLLDNNGILHVGAGNNIHDASQTLFIKDANGESLAIINCCEHEFGVASSQNAGTNPLDPIQQFYSIRAARKRADYVLVIVHGGHEQFPLPSIRMQDTYRFFVDAGADIVVNAHQHCYSGYEEYKDKFIYYGLGNLVFDRKPPYPFGWNEGILLSLELNNGQIKHKPIPYTQFDENEKFTQIADTRSFFENFEVLSRIIANRDKLKDEIEKYYIKCQKDIYTGLQPWPDKYFKGAFFRGWLPSLISKKSLRWLYNVVVCQSHRDKLEYFLNRNI